LIWTELNIYLFDTVHCESKNNTFDLPVKLSVFPYLYTSKKDPLVRANVKEISIAGFLLEIKLRRPTS